ncbi:hypothetical protein GCM10010971_41300 [Silvimonas amylolytica]|uniref:Uncharacterized protein n=1 Tax=Silvimonas amylolytica TaxID=449663 RepID=A0ABQ2PT85_9NEIS|nr:hypothetical protein GCM10010971_41300 [Silvimonas amylolytica]
MYNPAVSVQRLKGRGFPYNAGVQIECEKQKAPMHAHRGFLILPNLAEAVTALIYLTKTH